MKKSAEEELPLVTVFTLVYNTGNYVIDALESVRLNNYPNIQHIIIDDLSSDDSLKTVETWIDQNDYKCTFIKHRENRGVCKSLNEVLALATGKYMFGISDDLLMPEFIHTSVKELESAGEDYCLSFCDSDVIDEVGNALGIGHYNSHNISFDALPIEHPFSSIIQSNFINGVGAFYRTRCLREIGGYDESLYFEDWDINIRLLMKYKIKGINRKLTKYRRRKNSISETKNARYYESLILICFRILAIESSERVMLRRRIVDFVEYYFKAGGSSNRLYFKAFVQTINVKVLVFVFFKCLGISYETFEKFLSKGVESRKV